MTQDNIVCYNLSPTIENKLNIDNIILSRWKTFMEHGNFRYNIDSIREKILPGKFRFLVQFQPNRSTNRRTPQNMTSVRQKFNPDQFNFTKINKEKELVCELHNGDNFCKSPLSARDIVIINVSPIDLGHCLLVPQTESCLPQILTVHGIKLALETMFVSSSPNLKIAFNSLCGYASVNHLHWHLYFQSHKLPVQEVPLTSVPGTSLYTMSPDIYPAPGWVWTINSIHNLSHVAENVFKITDWLSNNDVAHNVFITRGHNSSGAANDNCIRVIVWAREAVRGAKDAGAFVMAVCELSGQMLVYQEEKYQDIDEEEIVTAMKSATLETFNLVFDSVTEIFKS